MQDPFHIFKGVSDLRSSNATRHDFHEMLMIALTTVLAGGDTCTDMAEFGKRKEDFLRRFMAPGTESRVTTRSPPCSGSSIPKR